MEPIKIVDKLTLRQYALRLAVKRANADDKKDALILAEQYERYIQEDVELPEYVDQNKDFKEIFGKFQESFNPNPWISADDEIKPAKGVQVLCALHYAVNNIVYEAMYYNPDEKEWYGGADDDNTNHVVAWLPIPEYRPTL